MSRLFFLFAIVALIYLLLKSFRRELPPENRPGAEDMVRCSHCGVHFPISEGIRADGRIYCCVAHRDAGKSRAGE